MFWFNGLQCLHKKTITTFEFVRNLRFIYDIIKPPKSPFFWFFPFNQSFLSVLSLSSYILIFQSNFICFVPTNSLFHELSFIKVRYLNLNLLCFGSCKFTLPFCFFDSFNIQFSLHQVVLEYCLLLLESQQKVEVNHCSTCPLVLFLSSPSHIKGNTRWSIDHNHVTNTLGIFDIFLFMPKIIFWYSFLLQLVKTSLLTEIDIFLSRFMNTLTWRIWEWIRDSHYLGLDVQYTFCFILHLGITNLSYFRRARIGFFLLPRLKLG